MRNFKSFLNEKRRNPDQNPKLSYYDSLEQYKDDSNIYVTLTQEEKVGINPHSPNVTPNGIYVYPLKAFWDKNPKYNRDLKMLEFDEVVQKSKWVYVLKSKCNMTNVSKYSMSDLTKDLEKIKKLHKSGYFLKKWSTEQFEQLLSQSKNDSDNYNEREKHPYRRLLNLVNYIAYGKAPPPIGISKKLDLGNGNIKFHNVEAQKIANYLRKMGYCGFVDYGEGLIHGDEYTQGYFLSKSAFTVVDKLAFKNAPVNYISNWKEFEKEKKSNPSGYDWVYSQLKIDPSDKNYAIYKSPYSVYRFKKSEVVGKFE